MLQLLISFIQTRWLIKFKSREQLQKYQSQQLQKFIQNKSKYFSYYQQFEPSLKSFPVVNKTIINENFVQFNRYKITREVALDIAIQAEKDRNFIPTIEGITVGLSSGTSGKRGLFLVSPKERFVWAGSILAKVLSTKSLCKVLNLFGKPLRIAFFLRANSNLYNTIQSKRVLFRYFDLQINMDTHIQELDKYKPDILIAPASILVEMASLYSKKLSQLNLLQVISVAEVLDKKQKEKIESLLNISVQEIYQCTEGFLGTSCKEGNIHLNEEFVHFEMDRIDECRFYPILTDFTRETQAFIRYRLNDILKVHPNECPCGQKTMCIDSIEGREDEVLWFRDQSKNQMRPIFPDRIRQLMYLISDELLDYRIVQKKEAMFFYLKVSPTVHLEQEVKAQFLKLLVNSDLVIPRIEFLEWFDQPIIEKKKRIISNLE